MTLFEPEFPCRVLETRGCPVSFGGVCGDRPCARYESDDVAPWVEELHTRRADVEAVEAIPTSPMPAPPLPFPGG